MSWILGLLGIPILIKRISDLEDKVEELETQVSFLSMARDRDLARFAAAFEVAKKTKRNE